MAEQSLQSFIEEHGAGEYLKVEDDLGNGFVRLRAAEAQRRQAKQDIRTFEDVVIEMLRNSRDAGANLILVATWMEGDVRRLTMIDDGSGIPSGLHETVFEPFVTSKLDTFHADRWGVHGRGMALYSIRQNVDEARIVASEPGLGSIFTASSPLARLGEKRDQSTLPIVVRGEDGSVTLRGPHNIARTVMEFAIEERGRRAVYLGSPAEIVSTLHHMGIAATMRLSELLDLDDSDLPYYQRFALALDAADLASLANELSLPISSRSAHRIIKGEVPPLKTHLELLSPARSDKARKDGMRRKSATQNTPAVRVAREDLDAFRQRVGAAFEPLAQAYYLSQEEEPSIQMRTDELVVRIPLRPLE